jgi:hypothetical protein
MAHRTCDVDKLKHVPQCGRPQTKDVAYALACRVPTPRDASFDRTAKTYRHECRYGSLRGCATSIVYEPSHVGHAFNLSRRAELALAL